MQPNRSTKGIVSYLLLTFGLAWGFWCIPLLFGLSLRDPSYGFFILPGAFAPAVAAFVVRKWVTREGFGDAGLRLNLRAGRRYYLAAWLLPLPVVAFLILAAIVGGIAEPDFSLERLVTTMAPERKNPLVAIALPLRFPILVVYALVTAVIATPILLGEEFGWRGYLQVRLYAHKPLLAAVVVGLIWGVWHYPINLQGYNYPDHRVLGLFLFPVLTVLLSIVFGWLRLQTGSVWAASLAHAAANAIGGGLTALLFMGGPNWIWVGYPGLLAWIPLGAVCAWIVLTGQMNVAASNRQNAKATNGQRGALGAE